MYIGHTCTFHTFGLYNQWWVNVLNQNKYQEIINFALNCCYFYCYAKCLTLFFFLWKLIKIMFFFLPVFISLDHADRPSQKPLSDIPVKKSNKQQLRHDIGLDYNDFLEWPFLRFACFIQAFVMFCLLTYSIHASRYAGYVWDPLYQVCGVFIQHWHVNLPKMPGHCIAEVVSNMHALLVCTEALRNFWLYSGPSVLRPPVVQGSVVVLQLVLK